MFESFLGHKNVEFYMNDTKKHKLKQAGFKIGSAWDGVGLTPEQAKKAEANYQKIKQTKN